MSFEMMSVLSVEDGLRTDSGDWEYHQGQEGDTAIIQGKVTDKGCSGEYGEKCLNLGYSLKISM